MVSNIIDTAPSSASESSHLSDAAWMMQYLIASTRLQAERMAGSTLSMGARRRFPSNANPASAYLSSFSMV